MQLANVPLRIEGVPRVHVHAASVGEFEQAKPIIEALRERHARCCITASFFSASGYEQQHAYAGLDAACFLPPESMREMRAFYELIDPDVMLVMRYDLWPEQMAAARERGTPVLLACGVMRSGSRRFALPWRGFFRGLYGGLERVHAVSPADHDAFLRLVPGLDVVVDGDTRYDRVLQRVSAPADLGALAGGRFEGRTVIVAGSTWPADETLLAPFASRADLALVIVPHEPTPAHVAELLARFRGSAPLSSLDGAAGSAGGAGGDGPDAPSVVIVDRTGLLSALYRIGAMAYVGGGFGEGVHSVLEPAAYGIPVIAGPRIGRSRDAEEMASTGALAVVDSPAALRDVLERLLHDPVERDRLGALASRFVTERAGATARIVEDLDRYVRRGA